MLNDLSPGSDVNLQLFARKHGGDYVMRSERRGGYGSPPSDASGGKRRKKKRAGAFYIAFTFLLSILVWPIGMIMLWRRKVRWKGATKLLASIITLVLCVGMDVFALTVQTGNPDITRVQDSVNDFFDHASENIGGFYQKICDRAVLAIDAGRDLTDAVARTAIVRTADGMDLAVKGADGLNALVDKIKKSNDAETTARPSIAPTETANATPAPTESAAPAVTASPAATENAAATASPEATEAPTEKPTAKPTVAPTPVVSVDLKPKPAGEATVYYKKGGKRYHMTENCSGMKNAPAGTLADAVSANYKSCSSCKSPDPAILEAEDVVWADENNLFHLSDECTNFTGTWSLMTLADALENGYSPCTTCKAGLYMATRAQTAENTSAPVTTATPAPTVTATAAPEVITPDFALKPAGEALVYHSSTGKWYHSTATCSGMSGASQYPLSECAGNYKWCRRCEPPKPEYLNENCLWQDENKLCHTTDECPSFKGNYTLIPRDEALEAGLTGCEMCGANRYLIPNTTINYISE